MERVKLRDITSKLQSGDGIKAGKIFEEGLFPVFGGNGLRGYTDTFNQDGEYFFIGRQGAKCGNVHYNIGKAFMTEHAVVGCPKEGYDAVYLAYKLSLLDLGKLQGQSAQPGLAVGTLADVELEIPEYRTQHDIGKLLYNIDQKISLNTRMNAELEAMAKQLYDYWFVQFDFPDENGKPYKSSGGKMVWNEKLKREIPEGWEVIDVKKICEVIDCLHSKKPEYNFESEDSYLLTLENITKDGYVDLTKKYYISIKDFEEWTSRICVKSGDFLFTNAGRAGDWGMVPKGVKCAIGRNITCVHPLSISPYYLRCFFASSYLKEQVLNNLDQGSFFMSFNVRSIKELQILIPAKVVLESFIQITKPHIDQIYENNRMVFELTHLRDSLLPMLMNGQVTIE